MKMKKLIFVVVAACVLTACQTTEKFNAERELAYCSEQVNKSLNHLCDSNRMYDYSMQPRNILKGETDWNCRKVSEQEWCSGFWPGVLWMTYGYTKDDSIRKAAEGYTASLSFLAQQPVYDHDLGFLVINSFLKGYEQTGSEQYKLVALACADTLATLFNEKVGTMLSWPRHVKDYGGHNTIMDNMINLELLFWAAQNGGDKHLADMAIRHAETTMQHHFRPDGSSYHVAIYDTLSGEFIKGVTHQGYSDSSMWSRGQSWAIYGYTMVYRYTHDKRFLDHAQKVTDIYLKRLRETSDDWIPLWDMDIPEVKSEGVNSEKLKDASAACVVASALLELCQYDVSGDRETVNGKSVNREYYEAAVNMLRDLSTERYQSRGRNVAFLMHSTGHHPAGSEIDASIVYADYYYLEALLRLK